MPSLLPRHCCASSSATTAGSSTRAISRSATVRSSAACAAQRGSRRLSSALGDPVSQVAGVAVKPSYAYFASYREGAELEIHRDRQQCEVSISFLIDYVPSPDGASPWPLWVGRTPRRGLAPPAPRRRHRLSRPRALPLARRAPGGTRIDASLHYVARDFAGAIE